MSFTAKDTQIYRQDERSGHSKLGVEEREKLVKVSLNVYHTSQVVRSVSVLKLI